MILESNETTVAYRCPFCGASIMSAVNVFSLSGDLIKLKCDCGKSELVITKERDDMLRLSVPCLFCPRPHIYTVSRKIFFSREIFTFPCAYSGLDMGYIGSRKAVLQALDETERQIVELAGKEAGDSYTGFHDDGTPKTGDEHIRDLIILVLGELSEDKDILCDCGRDGRFICDNKPDSVTITCKKCGKKRTFACDSSIDTQSLFDCEKLYLE